MRQHALDAREQFLVRCLTNVVAVQIIELLEVEARGAFVDVVNIEPRDKLFGRNDFVVAVAPPESHEVIAQCDGQITHGAVILDALGAVAFGEFSPISAVNERYVREAGHSPIHALINLRLARCVGQMIDTADNVRDAHVVIVDDDSEIVGWVAVGTQDDEIVEILVRECNLALDVIRNNSLAFARRFEAHRWFDVFGGVLGRAVAPGRKENLGSAFGFGGVAGGVNLGGRGVAMISGTALQEFVGDLAMAIGAGKLRDGITLPIKFQPFEAVEYGGDSGVIVALAVRILNAQQKTAVAASGVEPVEECRARAADMEVAGGGGGEAHDWRDLGRAFQGLSHRTFFLFSTMQEWLSPCSMGSVPNGRGGPTGCGGMTYSVTDRGMGREAGDDGISAPVFPASHWRAAAEDERARLFLWAPVALGLGVASYFSLSSEPGYMTGAALLLAALIVKFALPRATLTAALAAGAVLAALGFFAAKARVEWVRAPVLGKILVNVAVTGRIERIEPKATRGERITIAVETLGDLSAALRPERVRVRTMKSQGGLKPGDRVSFRATLSPPAKPALPGGFDFARTAWFERLGGVGYTFSAIKIEPRRHNASLQEQFFLGIESIRQSISARVHAALPGETGAIAAALITGERAGISQQTNDAFRGSGLFHILSISGLHMVVMAGAVFFSVRFLLALIPALALRFDIRKCAALAGIMGALAYLAISGGAFATVRSAITILIMFGAILIGRPALALRNVAIAAFVILLAFPESLFDAGFQMSFAAVTGLVATYEAVRQRFRQRGERHPVLQVGMFFGGIVLSTLVASAAVAPFAAYHFHQSQQYAVLANLIAIPVCNFLVMPAALAALVLMPFGLEQLALWPMGKGIDAMAWCAAKVAALPGATGHIPAIPPLAFVLFAFGGLWLALWQGRQRLMGVAMALAGLAVAPTLPRPDVLVARGGELVAVRAADGYLSALPARQSKFELERWLEHDGDARAAKDVAKAKGFTCDGVGCVARVKGVVLAVARHPAAIGDDCTHARVLVLDVPRPRGCEGAGTIIDFFDIWRNGTHALYIEPGAEPKIRVETVAALRGDRPWSKVPDRKHERKSDRRLPKPQVMAHVDGQPLEADTLPGFATRPEWLQPLPPRPEVEDGEEGEAEEGQ
jgi:competence protein ComEC